ncbi:MAG: purine-cytosine permease family protein [Enterobacteriaceae bacterium]
MGAANRNWQVESRTIDFIPESERHGHVFSQFTLWLGTNLQITAIVTGALTVVLGGDVVWSLLGLLVGLTIGGCFLGLIGSEGPKTGLGQMVSSRIMFGVIGASIPTTLVLIMYIGFNATGTILAGQSIAQLFSLSDSTGIIIFGIIIAVFAIFGYELIHRLGRFVSAFGVIAFIYMFYRIIVISDITILTDHIFFSWKHFLIAVSLGASWQIAYTPYASDYSRYLPGSTSSVKTFFAISSGTILGTLASMSVGVIAATLAGEQFLGKEVPYIVALASNHYFAALLLLSIILGKVMASSINAYGSLMCLTTILGSLREQVHVSYLQRIVSVLVIVCLSTSIALMGQSGFLLIFKQFLLFLLTFFAPWCAINLVGFYLITKGVVNYVALNDRNGAYGRWNSRGITAYLVGILVQLPFIGTSFYTGPLYAAIGEIDISWLISMIVAALLYATLEKRKMAKERSNTLGFQQKHSGV